MAEEKRLSAAQTISRKRRVIFLKVLAREYKVGVAAKAAGYADTSELYRARAEDEEFAQAWDDALARAADMLEEAAFDRAVNGVSKPILYKGEVVAEEITYSDSILLAMLGARKPEYRRDRTKVDVDVNVNTKIGIAVIPLTASAPDWEKQASVVHEEQRKLPDFTVIEGEKVTPAAVEQKTEVQQPPQQRELRRG